MAKIANTLTQEEKMARFKRTSNSKPVKVTKEYLQEKNSEKTKATKATNQSKSTNDKEAMQEAYNRTFGSKNQQTPSSTANRQAVKNNLTNKDSKATVNNDHITADKNKLKSLSGNNANRNPVKATDEYKKSVIQERNADKQKASKAELQDAYNRTFASRNRKTQTNALDTGRQGIERVEQDPGDQKLMKMVGNIVGGIANVPIKAFDVGKEALTSIAINQIENNRESYKRMGMTDEEIDAWIQSKHDEFDLNDENNLSNQIDKRIQENREDIYKNTNAVEKFAYQTLEGAGQFGAHALMAMATGGSSLVTMGLQAGTEKAYQNLQEGYDVNTAIGNGTMTGIMTALVEKLPVDNFGKLVTSPLAQFSLAAVASQAISEGAEEGLEYLIEPQIDKIMLGKEVEYSAGDFFMSVALGMSSGGLIGTVGNAVPIIKTRKAYNQLKADMNTLLDYMNTTELTTEERIKINQSINLAQEALNNFESKSVVGNAVQFESDKVRQLSAIEVKENLNKFLQPQADAFAHQETVNNIVNNAQTVLNRKGINMDVAQFVNLDDKVRQQVVKVQEVADKLGTNVVFNTDMYDMNGNPIDGAYIEGQGIVINPLGTQPSLSTFVHELTHGIEASQWYAPLKSLIIDSNANFTNDVQTIKDAYKSVTELDTEGAIKEYVAISTQKMLGNEQFVDRLVNYNNSLARRIFEGIKHIATTTNTVQNIEYNFMKAFKNNGLNVDGSSFDSNLVTVDENSGSVAPQFSLGTWTNTNKQRIVNDLVEKGIAENVETAQKWVNDVSGVAKTIADNKILLDYEANPYYSMKKKNSDYRWTIDVSTNCKKRIPLADTIDAIQKELSTRVLTGEDYIRIRQLMKDANYEVSCGFCYVESRRKDLGKVAEKFIEQYNDPSLTIYDLTTDEGVTNLRKYRPEVYRAFEKFNNRRGSGKVKLVESRTEYRGEIMNMHPATVNFLLKTGGLRLQSFSDFETPHLIDMMQVVMDMSRKGLSSQAYTKVPNFADAFGNTGIKINLSLVTKGLDQNGNLIFDDIEGMPHKQAFALRNKYSNDVGTVLVGKDDATILAAMADERIDYIIPYHRSGWAGREYEALGITGYEDYTDYQKEYWLEPKQITKKNGTVETETAPKKAIYPLDYWDFSKSGKENAETYLQLCAEQGKRPKFYNFLVDNGNGSYSLQPDGSTDGYWKTLIDFKMYNNDGVGAPQQPVKPIFDNEVNQRILSEYDGSHKGKHAKQDIVKKFLAEKAQFSIGMTTDSQGRTLTKEQQEYFKDSKVRDERGRLKEVYHGTEDYGFTVFDSNKSDDKLSFFFTDNHEMSQTYVNDDDKEYKVYLNLVNPLVVDANGNNWNNIKFGKLDDENLRNVDRFLDLNKNYYAPLSIYEFVESLGGLEEGVEYMISETEEDLKEGEENPYFTKEEKDELYELARKIDDAYNNWNDSDHLDEYGDETPFANYILDNQIKSLNTRQVSWKAKKEGHDGVIIKNLKDNGKFANARGTWSQGDVYIAFDSNQIKNVSNINPTSNPDIRYSIGLDPNDLNKPVQRLSEEQRNRTSFIQTDVGERLKQYGDAISLQDIENDQEIMSLLDEVEKISTSLGETINDDSISRKYIRSGITQRYIEEQILGKSQDKVASIILGPPGSGKSSVIAKQLLQEYNAVELDSDIVKEMTPEFSQYGGIYANAVHKESSQIAHALEGFIIDNGYNFVYPLVGKDTAKISGIIESLAKKGYNINVYDVSLPTEKSVVRAMKRFADTGRYIPINYLKSVGDLPDKTYDAVKHLKGVNNYARYSNDVKYGEKAILIEQGRNEQNFDSNGEPLREAWRNQEEIRSTGINGNRIGRSDGSSITSNLNNNENTQQADNGLFLHDVALDQYGAFEPGENPVRDVKIAQETDYGKTNRFARTIAESGSVTDEQVDLLKSQIGNGNFAYEPMSNEKLQEDANFKIEKIGLEKSIENYLQSDGYSSRSIAEGEILLDSVARSGDNDTAIKLASKLAMQLTEAGRAVQAARLLKRMSPQGQLVVTEKTIEKLQKSLDARYGKKAPQLEISDELKTKLLNAKDETEMHQVLDEISVEVSNQIPSTLMDKLNTWRYLAMLGNPRTHVRNVLGNAMFYPLVTMKNNIGTVLEAVVQKTGKLDTRTKSILNPLDANDKALIEFGKENFAEYKQIFEKSGKYDLAELIEKNRDVYSNNNVFGKSLNKLVKANSGALQWEDVFFSKQRYATSLAQYMKANNLTPEDAGSKEFVKAQEYAYKEALKQTYQDNNELANAITKMAKTNKATQLAVDAILPFKKTPLNILKRGVEYSPIGLLTSITNGSKNLKDGKITANEFIDGLSAGLTGTGVTLLGVLLSSMGIFRTKDDDKDRKQYYDEDLGEQDYALIFPHGSYTIDWASPMIMPLAIGAELFNGIDSFNGIDDLIDISSKITEPIFETSMLSGLTSTLQSYASGQEGAFNMLQNSMASYVNQYFPTLFGQIARSIDDTRRTTYPNSGVIDKTGKQILNKIPGLSYMNEPYINRKGEQQKQEGNNLLSRMMLNMLSPGYYKTNTMDEYDEELLRLYEIDNNADALPSSSSKSLTYEKEKYDLTDEAYTNFHETRYTIEREDVNKFIDSLEYELIDDNTKISIIGKIREYAGMEAKKEYLDSIGIEYEDSSYDKIKGALDSGLSLHEYFLSKSYYNSLKGDRKGQYVDYLLSTGYDTEAMSYLYDSVYKKGDITDYVGSGSSGLTLEEMYAKTFGSSKENVGDSNEEPSTKVSTKTSTKLSSGSKKTGGKKGITSSSKTTEGSLFLFDEEKEKIDNILAKVYSGTTSTDSAYKKINNILKKVQSSKNMSKINVKSQYSKLIKDYLKNHPEDAVLFK